MNHDRLLFRRRAEGGLRWEAHDKLLDFPAERESSSSKHLGPRSVFL